MRSVRRPTPTPSTRRPTHARSRPHPGFVLVSLIIGFFAGSAMTMAHAQSPAESTAPDAATPAPIVRDEVELTIAKLGPGNLARAGSWAGVLIEYRDSALAPREIVLRITGVDRDGDPPAYERTVVGDPERPRGAWLYAPLPDPTQATRLTVTAHEAIEDASTAGFRAGRVLGRAVIDTSRLVQGESGLIGVVGSRDAGLRQYGLGITTSIRHLALGHATTEIIAGLTLRDLPDRWQGLDQFDVLVWSRGGPDTDPNALDADRARAIREWIQRGGHLVVLLPPVGQAWTAGTGRNPLADLLPAVRIERREGIPLEPYRPLLTLRDDARLPRQAIVHTLTPLPDATTAEASPLLAGPDGVPVVVRRLVGTGMVTAIGLDITADSLTALDTLDAETIWHRVLGKRHSLESSEEVKDRDLNLFTAIQRRVVSDFDADFEQAIDFRGDAGKGVLLGLAVFALYWLVAGPLGFFLLTKSGHRSRSWLAFLATSAIFTAIAWAGATVLRPNSVRATHLTFLTGVHGTERQNANSWLSVLIPSYGEATIRVGGESSSDLISVWTPPPPAVVGGGFPDNRGYTVSARAPSQITVPVRSTIKQLAAEWSGPPIANMPRPVREPGEPGEPSLVLADAARGQIEGEIIHDLPGDLEDLLVVVVAGQRPLAAPTSIIPVWLPSRVFMDALADPWPAGTRLDLAEVTAGSPGQRNALTWLSRKLTEGAERTFGPTDPRSAGSPADRYAALGFLDMLGTPAFLENNASTTTRLSPIAAVRTAHGLDLSRWFTQPCVMIIGTLKQSEGDLPYPLTVDGKPVPAKGSTIVRWVYPLEPDPPEYTPIEP